LIRQVARNQVRRGLLRCKEYGISNLVPLGCSPRGGGRGDWERFFGPRRYPCLTGAAERRNTPPFRGEPGQMTNLNRWAPTTSPDAFFYRLARAVDRELLRPLGPSLLRVPGGRPISSPAQDPESPPISALSSGLAGRGAAIEPRHCPVCFQKPCPKLG